MSVDKLTDYLARIRGIQPDLQVQSARLNEEGLANDVVIVNDAWVFRFAKGEFGLQSLARDKQVLRTINPHISLPIPTPLNMGEDFIVYRWLAGVDFTRKVIQQMDEQAVEEVANQLATFLKQLHGITVDDSLPKTSAPSNRAFWVNRQREVERMIYPLLLKHQRDWAEDLFETMLADPNDLAYEPRLIHGDLAPYHILFDSAANHLSGVIDFGVAGLGDPATDIGSLLTTYGASFVRRMEPGYPQLRRYMKRARFYTQAIELEWVLHGLNHGESFWFTAHLGGARDLS